MVIALGKLSSEYELIVITSFGLNPKKILNIFLPISLGISVILIIFSIGLIPKTKFLTKQFLNQKKKEANFNIKASEFGQKFGDWLIYIDEENDKTYKNIKLFKAQDGKEQFILSKSAILSNDKGELNFYLKDGKAFYMDDFEINQINFQAMHINDSVSDVELKVFTNPYDYWKEKFRIDEDVDDFVFFILISIFPTISLYFIITFGYFNPRYEKNRAVSNSIITIVLYYIISKPLSDSQPFAVLVILPILWIATSYIMYSKSIKKEY
jgi:lipopolysaccharide export system permease protein